MDLSTIQNGPDADDQSMEKTCPFSDGPLEDHLKEVKDSLCLARGWISEDDEAKVMAEPSESHGRGTEQTLSFPEGYVESRVEVIRQQYEKDQETLPIFELEIEQLGPRLLIQPSNLDTFEALSGKWICLCRPFDR